MRHIEKRRLFAMALSTWISGWLKPANAKSRSFSNVADLRAFVIEAIRKQPGIDSVLEDPRDPAKFTVVEGGTSSTNDVANLFGYLKAYPEEDADQLIQRFLNARTKDSKTAATEANLVVVVRSRDYVAAIQKEGIHVLNEPLGADLVALYMIDRPDSMAQARPEDFPGKDLASLRPIALANVRRWLPSVVADNQLADGTLYYVKDNTMLSTSLILLDEFWKSVSSRFPGDVLIAIPRKDQLFVFDDGNAAERSRIRRLIDGTFQDNFNLLSPKLYARRSGKIIEERG